MEKYLILYTMDNCPYCKEFKELLKVEGFDFFERDIVENEDEYDMFVEATGGNEFVPAFMIIETDGLTHNTKLFAPERDFEELTEGIQIIKEIYEGSDI